MKTVLVVEDTEDLREMFVAIIREAGYRVIGAEHGQHALEILRSLDHEPCLVLLDWTMPVMDGHTFLRALRGTHRIAALPVVIVSAAQGVEGQDAQRMVKKPICATTLMHLVRDFCG
jgi:CheY-like chemotaxis protein